MQTERIIEHISTWMRDYAGQAGAKGFVVGISGGIDSAVTSSLAARSGMHVLCVEMPIHQPESQVSRAWEHIRRLEDQFENVRSLTFDITPVFDRFVNSLPPFEDPEAHERSLVNARARLRMTTLYYFAQLYGYLVAGTGNKVEDFGVGFFTKYGDGGVDLSPIADLMKTEVYQLGKAMNVPESILSAKPTDGLWGDDRSDEDQIGASYPELEWAMKAQAKGKTASDFSGREKEVFEIFERMHRANKHKMVPIPVCEIPEDLK